MTREERAERERRELLDAYTAQLRSALNWRHKDFMRHRRTGAHLGGWYSEVRKAQDAVKHIRALRSAALDAARAERDAARAKAETYERDWYDAKSELHESLRAAEAAARAAAIEECAKWVEERGWQDELLQDHERRGIARRLRALLEPGT
jgi:hypothetical protein